MDHRITLAVGYALGVASAIQFAVNQNKKFCRFDDKKTALVNDIFAELQNYAPPEVIENVRVKTAFFAIEAREDL